MSSVQQFITQNIKVSGLKINKLCGLQDAYVDLAEEGLDSKF